MSHRLGQNGYSVYEARVSYAEIRSALLRDPKRTIICTENNFHVVKAIIVNTFPGLNVDIVVSRFCEVDKIIIMDNGVLQEAYKREFRPWEYSERTK